MKWTEPAGAAGYTVSVVTYHYTMNDVPEWAKSAEVQREYPEIKNDLDGAGKAERQAQLVLTNQGWEVPAH